MAATPPDEIQAARAQGAAEERIAILEIIERYTRQLSHGHGVSGGQVLQHIADEILRRDEPPAAGEG